MRISRLYHFQTNAYNHACCRRIYCTFFYHSSAIVVGTQLGWVITCQYNIPIRVQWRLVKEERNSGDTQTRWACVPSPVWVAVRGIQVQSLPARNENIKPNLAGEQ